MTKNKQIPKYLFLFSLLFIAFFYGLYSGMNQIFPYKQLREAYRQALSILNEKDPMAEWYYVRTDHAEPVPTCRLDAIHNGPTLITSVEGDKTISAKVIMPEGQVIHEWNVDWFDIWPDCSHIPEQDIPKMKPGTHIHGCVLMENGDLVFNFEDLGLVRLNACSDVVWRLPYRTHHSVFWADGNLWVCGKIEHSEKLPQFQSFHPPFIEPTVLKVSPDGEILSETSVFHLLEKNDLLGLLVLSTIHNDFTYATGDFLHLNDVEYFSDSLQDGFFKPGDIMISLRNINAILVYQEENLKIKYKSIGGFVRQHDPDFIDANTISIFDNNNIKLDGKKRYSKILIESVNTNRDSIYFTGSRKHPFYTNIMGKHQWLPNGNLLIIESMKGRVFEIDDKGEIVWEYINIVDSGYAGIVEDAIRLSPEYDKTFFRQCIENCQSKTNELAK